MQSLDNLDDKATMHPMVLHSQMTLRRGNILRHAERDCAMCLQVTMQSVEEQARLNADAMQAAARAGQAADALGPGRRASGSPSASTPNAAMCSDNSPELSNPEALGSSVAAEQRGRKSSLDRKTVRQPELQPFCSPRKAARQRLSERSAACARAELVRGQTAEDPDLHAEDEAAARLLEEEWTGKGRAQGSEGGFRADKRRPVLAQVDRRLFGRILFSFDTMPHHLPDTYLTALQEL